MKFKKFIDEVKEKKNTDTNKILNDATKGSIIGASIGGITGAAFGLFRKKNILFSILIGTIIGGVISKAINDKLNKTKTKKNENE